MSDKINFTKAAIDSLPLPGPGQRKFYYDTKVRGLAIRVAGNGSKAFYMYRWVAGKPQKSKLGPYPDMTIEQARKRAEEENAAIALGKDPAAERAKKKAEWTFDELFDWYLEHHAKVRKRSWERDKQNYENHLKADLGPLPITKVTRAIVRDTHMAIRKKTGPYAANRLLALMAVIFSKAIAHEIHPGPNPAAGVEPYPEESRDRRLTADEVPRLLAALEQESNTTVRDFVYMLLFTGARRDNVLAMRWDQIDFLARTWRIPMTKNGKPQIVPLEEPELALLQRRLQEVNGSPWVFPGRKDTKTGHLENPYEGWYRICERAGLGSHDEKGRFRANIRLHDLRRSLGSWMVDTGASLPVIGQTLHHQSQATTAVYARLSLDPVRQAKSRALQAILEAGGSKPLEAVAKS
ncbi:putative prophage CPS-53 integrase [compost metagenome]